MKKAKRSHSPEVGKEKARKKMKLGMKDASEKKTVEDFPNGIVIRNLSKQIDTEKRDRREDRRRRDVSDDADERDRRWDRRRCVNSTERKRSKERRRDDSRVRGRRRLRDRRRSPSPRRRSPSATKRSLSPRRRSPRSSMARMPFLIPSGFTR